MYTQYVLTLPVCLISISIAIDQFLYLEDMTIGGRSAVNQTFCKELSADVITDTDYYWQEPCRVSVSCSEDDTCAEYGNCCSGRSVDRHTSCVGIKSGLKESHYYMISSCPSAYASSPDVIQKCESLPIDTNDVTTHLPVKSVGSNGKYVTYRNKYCASCHGVNESNILRWTATIECNQYRPAVFPKISSLEDVTKFFAEHNPPCFVKYAPPDGYPEVECEVILMYMYTDSCDTTWIAVGYNETTKELCETRLDLFWTDGRLYANKYCHMCNNVIKNSTMYDVTCERPITSIHLLTVTIPTALPPLSMLIDFNPKAEYSIEKEDNETACLCEKGSVYDMVQGACRELFCPKPMTLIDEDCIAPSASGIPFMIDLRMLSQSRFEIGIHDYDNTLIALVKAIRGEIFINNTYFELAMILKLVGTYTWSHGFIAHARGADITIYGIAKNVTDMKEISSNMLSSLSKTWMITVGKNDVSFKAHVRHIVEEADASGYHYALSMMRPTQDGLIYTDAASVVREWKLTEITYTIISLYTNKTDSRFEFLRITPLYNCSIVRLNKTEYEEEGTDVVFHGKHMEEYDRYSNGDVVLCSEPIYRKDDVRGCERDAHNNTTQSLIYIAKSLTTFAVLCVSGLCLLLTLLTYALFKSLRTMPGVNNMFLVASLIAAHASYILAAYDFQSEVVCTTFGVALHYSWLTSFFWMNVCSYHVYIIFRNVMISRDKHGVKRIIAYAAYAFVTPAIIVGATIGASYVTSSEETIGYGGNTCYLSSTIGISIAFALPLGIIIAINMFFYVSALRILHSAPKMHSNQEHTRSMFVYTKLATLTGITWVSGFVAAGAQLEPLWFLFIILCGGQGVMLFVSFVCNHRVAVLYRQLFKCRTRKDKREQQHRLANDTATYTKSKSTAITKLS